MDRLNLNYNRILFLVLLAATALAISQPGSAQPSRGRPSRPAGHETGSGGDGVRIGTHLYLLDLVEAGVELEPYFDPTIEPDPAFQPRLEAALRSLNPPGLTPPLDVTPLNHKINEVSQKISPFLARLILLGIEKFNWRLVSQALVDVPDEDSVLSVGQGQLVQLAIRRDTMIYVGRQIWAEMTNVQKIATILHEMFYAWTPLDCSTAQNPDGTRRRVCRQSSEIARAMTGLLFTNFNAANYRALLGTYRFAERALHRDFRLSFESPTREGDGALFRGPVRVYLQCRTVHFNSEQDSSQPWNRTDSWTEPSWNFFWNIERTAFESSFTNSTILFHLGLYGSWARPRPSAPPIWVPQCRYTTSEIQQEVQFENIPDLSTGHLLIGVVDRHDSSDPWEDFDIRPFQQEVTNPASEHQARELFALGIAAEMYRRAHLVYMSPRYSRLRF